MPNKEIAPRKESVWEKARRHIEFPLNRFVGRRSKPDIEYHLNRLEECTYEIKEQGGNPADLIDVVEKISKNCGGLPRHKQGIVASIMNILMGKGPKRFP